MQGGERELILGAECEYFCFSWDLVFWDGAQFDSSNFLRLLSLVFKLMVMLTSLSPAIVNRLCTCFFLPLSAWMDCFLPRGFSYHRLVFSWVSVFIIFLRKARGQEGSCLRACLSLKTRWTTEHIGLVCSGIIVCAQPVACRMSAKFSSFCSWGLPSAGLPSISPIPLVPALSPSFPLTLLADSPSLGTSFGSHRAQL